MDRSTACRDWETKILAGESIIPAPLFPDYAATALRVFRELTLVDVTGSPKIGQIARPWLIDFVAAIFGAYEQESGRRLIREFLLSISKKNGKSTIAAGIMLTALILNWRKSAEFLILAPTVEIADNSFRPARDMIKADAELATLLQVQDHIRTITHRTTGATLKVVAADNEAVGGKKAVGVLVDELWLFGKRANAENMLREATGGMASRPEGFTIYLTTQSDDPPAGVFRQKLMYARKVRDGEIDDPAFLPVLYEFPPAMLEAKAYLQPENFGVTNPNLGASVDRAFLERGLKQAQETGPGSVAGFLAKHLNVEIGLALRSDRWPGADYWQTASEPLTLDELLARSEVVEIGIDGGGLDDLLGLYVLGRESNGHKLGWGRAWASKEALERRKSNAPRLHDLARAGELSIVDRVGEDVAQLGDIVERVRRSGLLDRVGCDPAGIGAIVEECERRGVPHDSVIGVSQGWRLGGYIQTCERWLADGSLTVADQKLMAWCVGNAKVEPRGNAILITKQASGTAKIDPLMAMFCAVAHLSLNPPAKRGRMKLFTLTR